ncbi:1-acyl-sn-glycerol-3-phosphate acyltransferase [Acuticoccus sp. M5D2P5]|uniref:lysophospholipid acyltransferase family protein n=1 Tax=Acuticoccus kalidii TaxID=2910977 RepID=UPI001F4619A1|nr:lysophospholipid acyltransferase family protein [Acuticoccus kalidii]MCF3935883.1 1-acyl-sn-glycerol-3-phosphate acyltransferase [Acuticoccus kalidii]
MRGLALVLLRPVWWLLFGLSVGGRERLPREGPAIVAANHNSHFDILFLLSAFDRRAVQNVRVVGAADYFLATPVLRFVALRLIGLLPIERRVERGAVDPLEGARAALAAGRILIVFPEGTRGAPEEMGRLKSGLTKLVRETGAPIVPVYLQGAGRILPRGARVPVPFTCTMLVGRPIAADGDRAALMARLGAAFARLKAAAPPLHWT